MTILLPGDILPLPSASTSAIKLGPGLLPTPSSSSPSLTAIRPGALGHLTSKKKDTSEEAYWIETNTQRYIPSPNDSVIGQITNRGSESYTLALFSSHSATLPALSFEGATKRHKPNLRIGSLVYARIVSADRFTEPELTCVNPITGKGDGFGELKTTNERGEKEGHAMLFKVSIGLARTLLRGGNGLLKKVAEQGVAFEAAVGANGCVWVRGEEVRHVVGVGRVLEEADQVLTRWGTGEEGEEEEGEGVDADYVLKNRAGGLDAKRVRGLIGDLL